MHHINTTGPGGDRSLVEVRDEMLKHLDDGVKCPCCCRAIRVYRRRIHSKMAADLIRLFWMNWYDTRPFEERFHHIQAICRGHPGDFAKLRYWKLIEEMPLTDEHKRTSGFWRITDKGRDFVQRRGSVPRQVKIYMDRFKGYVSHDDLVSITDCLGKHFDYLELMTGGEVSRGE